MAVGVSARLHIKPHQLVEFERLFLAFQHKVRSQEPGVVYFHLHRSRTTEGQYLVMEQYVDEAAYAAHQATEHYQKIPETFAGLMVGPPVIEVYDSV